MNKLHDIIVSFICGVVIVLILLYFFMNLITNFYIDKGYDIMAHMSKKCIGSFSADNGLINCNIACNMNK